LAPSSSEGGILEKLREIRDTYSRSLRSGGERGGSQDISQNLPRKDVGSTNPIAIAGYEVDAKLEEATRAKEADWKAKGYSPGLITKALNLAREWPAGLIASPLYRQAPEEYKRTVLANLYTIGLEVADRWISAIARS